MVVGSTEVEVVNSNLVKLGLCGKMDKWYHCYSFHWYRLLRHQQQTQTALRHQVHRVRYLFVFQIPKQEDNKGDFIAISRCQLVLLVSKIKLLDSPL